LSFMVQTLFDRLLPRAEASSLSPSGGEGQGEEASSLTRLLDAHGFDRAQHEQIRADLRSARIGLAQNRLRANTDIRDVLPEDVSDFSPDSSTRTRTKDEDDLMSDAGANALSTGKVAVV